MTPFEILFASVLTVALACLLLGLFGSRNRSVFRRLSVVSFLTLALLFLGQFSHPPMAMAQNSYGTNVYSPNFWTAISNYNGLWVPSNSVTVSFSPLTNQPITIRQNQGSGWQVCIAVTNTVSGSGTIFFDVSDTGATNHWTGTNTHYLAWTIPLISSSTNTYFTNFSRDTVNNSRNIFPTLVSNSITGQDYQIQYLEETHGNQ